MILVDTSVWIDHLHHTEPGLVHHLGNDDVVTHVGIIEELSLGAIRDRTTFLALFEQLRHATELTHAELAGFVDRERLWGRGLSVIDAQLLGAARIDQTPVWTRDERLLAAAQELGVEVISG